MEDRIRQSISSDLILPSVGQSAIGLEARVGDDETRALISVLDDETARYQVVAKSTLNTGLNGGSQVRIACHATIEGTGCTCVRWSENQAAAKRFSTSCIAENC